jgi:hypothetical protein
MTTLRTRTTTVIGGSGTALSDTGRFVFEIIVQGKNLATGSVR